MEKKSFATIQESAVLESSPAQRKILHHDEIAQEAIGGLYENMPPGYYGSAKFIGTVVATCLAQISGFLGWVLPSTTLSLIASTLGESSNIVWVPLAWTLGIAVSFTLVGRLSDIFGRRWFFIGSCLIALVGNIIGAVAQSVNMLIATNIINGFAAAGQLSFTMVLGELVPNKQRGLYNNLVLSTSIPFAVFGPPIARALYENTVLQWRWSYILGCIVNVAAIVLYIIFYYPPAYQQLHITGKSKLQQLRTLDYVGILLCTTGLALFLVGLNWGGSVYSWNSFPVLCTLLIGLLILVMFCFWEAYTKIEYPLMPMRLFLNVKYDAIVVCASIGAIVYYSMTVMWPILVSSIYTNDVKEVGWMSTAVGGGLLAGQIAAGIGVRYFPRMKYQMLFASVILVAFVSALATSTEYSRTRTVLFILIGCAAAGYVENLAMSSVTLVWEPEDIGLVYGVFAAMGTAAGSIAIALYSSLLSNGLKRYVPEYVSDVAANASLPASFITDLLENIVAGSTPNFQGIAPELVDAIEHAVKRAYSMSFRIVFLSTLPFGAILLVSAILTPNVEDYLTNNVARKLQGKQTIGSSRIDLACQDALGRKINVESGEKKDIEG